MIEPSEQIRARLDAEWEDRGLSLAAREREMDRARDSLAWEMGDWISERPTGYGDMTRLAEKLDVPLGTLKNRASVARRIEPSRRRDDLSWSHHSEVAGLEPEQRDAVLAEAALYSWPVDRLREVMKDRGAAARAEREADRLRAENAALRAERNGPDAARRAIDATRADVAAGLDMIEEGYRRIRAALASEDLAVAAAGLHGNARRRLAPSLQAMIGTATDNRIGRQIDEIEKALRALDEGANRHDAGTIEIDLTGQTEAPPGQVAGHSP